MDSEEVRINCSLFQKQEPIIKNIIHKINQAEDLEEKVKNAFELQRETNIVLSCQEYSPKNIYCKNCHFIANIRKQTADIIINTKRLRLR